MAHPDVVAVVRDMDANPEKWRPYYIGADLFHLDRDGTDLKVWTANSAYGVDISSGRFGVRTWGGVTGLSSLGLSPSHWSLWNAVKRWKRKLGGRRINNKSVAEILAQA